MSTIELSESSIKILDKQILSDRQLILVSVDVSGMSFDIAEAYLKAVTDKFAEHVHPAQVLVHPKGIEVSIIENQSTIEETV